MITPFNPDDWMDVVVLFGLSAIGVFGTIAVAVLPVWMNLRKQNHQLKTIKHEVKNDHGDDTNLRDDVDTIKDILIEIKEDISALRTDVQQEREDRIEGDRLRLIRGHR
ncbi:DUF2746 domain-containing protein [Mycobacteroides abscessus]|uniref:DUF2746 domain-containing protein n=1 Tax=Mycobacteroides abscessus TaxID=36809 RepID=UPI001F29A6D0|nr:DUF2746 domain-containing protein [Mycobacteroides abscessus]